MGPPQGGGPPPRPGLEAPKIRPPGGVGPLETPILAYFRPFLAQNGPFLPPRGPPRGGDPPPRGTPPLRGGSPPRRSFFWPARPLFYRDFPGGKVAHQGDPLGLPLFGPFWPFFGLFGPFLALDPPPGGVPPPPGAPQAPLGPSEGPPRGPLSRGVPPLFSRRFIGLVPRFYRDFPRGHGHSSLYIPPRGGGHSQISSTKNLLPELDKHTKCKSGTNYI